MGEQYLPRLGSLLTVTTLKGSKAKLRFQKIIADQWLCGLKKADSFGVKPGDMVSIQCVVNEELCTYRGRVISRDESKQVMTLNGVAMANRRRLRRSERLQCKLRATVTWINEARSSGQSLYQRRYCTLVNLSHSGAYLYSNLPIPDNHKELVLYTELPLPDTEDHMVILRGNIVRQTREGGGDSNPVFAYGIEFHDLLDWCEQDLQRYVNTRLSMAMEQSA